MFWVVQNSYPLTAKMNIIITRKISILGFSTLYTNFPHQDIIQVLHKLVECFLNGECKDQKGFRRCLILMAGNFVCTKEKHGFNSYMMQQVKIMINCLIKKRCFMFGKLVILHCIGNPMEIDPVPFWANLYLYD